MWIYLKKLFHRLPENLQAEIKDLLARNNCSMIFEVISQEDTHIIKYDQDHLYVLDMIQNNTRRKWKAYRCPIL